MKVNTIEQYHILEWIQENFQMSEINIELIERNLV
jgi:hypothetical protein